MSMEAEQVLGVAVKYRDMTEEQMLAWGRAESAARQVDLSVRSAEGLKAAQANAHSRRRLIGATTGQAADMVIRANRQARIDGAALAKAQGEVA